MRLLQQLVTAAAATAAYSPVRPIRDSIRIDGPIRNKFSNRPLCQSSFVKKRLVMVKFAFKVDFGSKISVQQHCLACFMTELK